MFQGQNLIVHKISDVVVPDFNMLGLTVLNMIFGYIDSAGVVTVGIDLGFKKRFNASSKRRNIKNFFRTSKTILLT